LQIAEAEQFAAEDRAATTVSRDVKSGQAARLLSLAFGAWFSLASTLILPGRGCLSTYFFTPDLLFLLSNCER
jgi:hypothetical protein